VNCAGPGGAAGFATQHKIAASLHFHQENIPSEFGLKYVLPYTNDGSTVLDGCLRTPEAH
jgi:hypothetical protein